MEEEQDSFLLSLNKLRRLLCQTFFDMTCHNIRLGQWREYLCRHVLKHTEPAERSLAVVFLARACDIIGRLEEVATTGNYIWGEFNAKYRVDGLTVAQAFEKILFGDVFFSTEF